MTTVCNRRVVLSESAMVIAILGGDHKVSQRSSLVCRSNPMSGEGNALVTCLSEESIADVALVCLAHVNKLMSGLFVPSGKTGCSPGIDSATAKEYLALLGHRPELTSR